MSNYTSNTGVPNTSVFDDSTSQPTNPLARPSDTAPLGDSRHDAHNPLSTTAGARDDHRPDDNEGLASKLNPFRNKHNEPPSSMLTGEYVPGSGNIAGSANDEFASLPISGRDNAGMTTTGTTNSAGPPSAMNAGGGITGTDAGREGFLDSTTSSGAGGPHHSGHSGNAGGQGDSMVGKIMQKAGAVVGNEKMQQKGQDKREQKGYDGVDIVSSTNTAANKRL